MNCQLPIANCQLFAARCGLAGRGKDGGQLASFLLQRCQSLGGHELIVGYQVQPELHFICFFLSHSDLCNELSARTRFASRPIICRCGGSRAAKLIRQDATFYATGTFFSEVENSERKFLRPFFQFFSIHA
jgi:hypothetical protein